MWSTARRREVRAMHPFVTSSIRQPITSRATQPTQRLKPMSVFVHALFRDEATAATAVKALIDAHFNPDLVSALMRADSGVQEATPTFKMPIGKGAVLGTALGALGGPILAASGLWAFGPLTAVVLGAWIGGWAGALGGFGYWKDELDFPKHVEGGMILVGISTEEGSVERARIALAAAHPERIHVSKKGEACEEVDTGILAQSGPST